MPDTGCRIPDKTRSLLGSFGIGGSCLFLHFLLIFLPVVLCTTGRKLQPERPGARRRTPGQGTGPTKTRVIPEGSCRPRALTRRGGGLFDGLAGTFPKRLTTLQWGVACYILYVDYP